MALATVIQTWGSAPQPVGSHLLVDGDGNFLGSVSGGCVEGAVIAEAPEVLASVKPKTLQFGVEDSAAWKVGLTCGGTIRVFLENRWTSGTTCCVSLPTTWLRAARWRWLPSLQQARDASRTRQTISVRSWRPLWQTPSVSDEA